MISIHKETSDTTLKPKPLVFPEQMQYVCEELDDLRQQNLELHSMVNLYAQIIKQMGDKIVFLADEAEHLDRLLKVSDKHNERLESNRD